MAANSIPSSLLLLSHFPIHHIAIAGDAVTRIPTPATPYTFVADAVLTGHSRRPCCIHLHHGIVSNAFLIIALCTYVCFR